VRGDRGNPVPYRVKLLWKIAPSGIRLATFRCGYRTVSFLGEVRPVLIHIEIDPASIAALAAAVVSVRGAFVGFRARSRRRQNRLLIQTQDALEAPTSAFPRDNPPSNAETTSKLPQKS
jgi:hypothetical protein